MMQHRIWHCRQHKQRWACIGIDKVGPKRGAKELMAGVRAQQQESLNAEGGCRGQERICVNALPKCHVSSESMFKEGRRSDLFFIPSILMHTSDFMLHF